MERQIMQQLVQWRHQKPRKPLILRGVRQCGKTYILKAFGESEFSHTHYFNFEKDHTIHSVFSSDLNPKQIVTDLSFYLNRNIDPKNDLLIFDEIQACPHALTSLKYFAEEMPQMAICAAGSLLGLSLASVSFPVGKVDFLEMYPMNFREFLLALEDQRSVEFIEHLDHENPITPLIHDHLWTRMKWYWVTGGLPEVVNSFINCKDNLFEAFKRVRAKQAALLYAYYADIAKHCGKQNAMHIERVLQSVPQQLARVNHSGASRFQFTDIVPGIDRYQRLAGAIDWLKKANLIIQVPIVNVAKQPLHAQAKESLFKLYLFDVGLLGMMNDLHPKVILDFTFETYKGYFAENFVAQEMMANLGGPLYCWKQHRAEVDFLKQKEDQIIPVEVKAGRSTHYKSLEKYRDAYQPQVSLVFHGGKMSFDQQLYQYHLPLYLVGWWPSIIERTNPPD